MEASHAEGEPGGSVLGGVLAWRSSSRGAPRACSALRATSPCVTLTPSGAQAGEMLKAAQGGALEEVRTLIQDRADIDEESWVSDGAGTSVAAGFSVACCFEHGPGV